MFRSVMKLLTLCGFLMLSTTALSQTNDDSFLRTLLESRPDLFSAVLQHPDQNEIQLLYTQINRDQNQVPHLTTYGYRVNETRYFYPASTVKLAAVIFALEKINELRIPSLHAGSTMITGQQFPDQTSVEKDSSASSGLPSVKHYIKKILLTSDNDAFNRLFEFVGRAEMNQKLHHYGMKKSRILNRLAIGDGGEASKHTNPIRFYTEEGQLIYEQAEQYDPKEYPLTLQRLIVGKGYFDHQEQLVNEPYSFENKNVFTLPDQHSFIQRLFFPEIFPEEQRFRLTPEDYALIYTYMGILPQESKEPRYDPNEFWPNYAKMLYFGREKGSTPPSHIRSFNKYGDSYGFIIDNMYFVDFEKKIEFFLTAVIQSNEDGIYNDGKYEYETVCYPFMKHLGRIIYEYELNRTKNYLPDLSRYQLKVE